MKKELAVLVFSASLCSGAAPPARVALPPLLAEADEIQAALEAAPPHLRAGAGVYVLERNGYRLARQGSNGFQCLVERVFVDDFAPECFDAEGTATLVPVVLYRAAERARGASLAEIDGAVARRYSEGKSLRRAVSASATCCPNET